jgi:hypothetical protein
MPLPEIVTTGTRDGSTVFTNPFDFRGDFGYDQELLGRLGLDVFDDDIVAQELLNEQEMQAAGAEFMLRQQANAGFQYDPNKDKSAEQQFLDFASGIEEQLRNLNRDGFITSEAATSILKEMLEGAGVRGKGDGEVKFDPTLWEQRRQDVRQDSGGLLKLPDLSSLDSSKTKQSVGDILTDAGSVIAANTGGGTTDAADTTGATVGTVVSGNEGVGTGGGLLGGASGTNPDGTPIYEGTGPITTKTPQEQWQDILNDPDMTVAGAVAAADLIFGNSPEGVAAVVDAANARGVSAEDVAANSDYSLSDIIAAANATGKVFTKETNAPTTTPTPTNPWEQGTGGMGPLPSANAGAGNGTGNGTDTGNGTGDGIGTGPGAGVGIGAGIGMFQAALAPQQPQQSIVQGLFSPELLKLGDKLSLDINQTLFGGRMRA